MDVIRAFTIGVTNTVATMGTAVTKNQALLIKKMARDVILCFDGDEAGAKATMACVELFNEIGVIPKVVRLEEGLDPDEYILKHGAAKFISKIDNPINVMDFKLSYLKKNKERISEIVVDFVFIYPFTVLILILCLPYLLVDLITDFWKRRKRKYNTIKRK